MTIFINYWQQTLEEFNLHGDIWEDTIEVMILIKVTGFLHFTKINSSMA